MTSVDEMEETKFEKRRNLIERARKLSTQISCRDPPSEDVINGRRLKQEYLETLRAVEETLLARNDMSRHELSKFENTFSGIEGRLIRSVTASVFFKLSNKGTVDLT